jgi:hypothetical protein
MQQRVVELESSSEEGGREKTLATSERFVLAAEGRDDEDADEGGY